MDTNEMIVNEDVIKVTEEIANASFEKSFKITAGVGVVILGGGLAYKYAIKPAIAKIKAKKEQQTTYTDFDETEDTEIDE